MAQSNTQAPGTGSNMADIGDTYTWLNPGNITGDDASYATFTIVGDLAVNDNSVNLVDASGNIAGNNYASATNWPSSVATATYGGSTDTWGLSLAHTDVEDTDFGVAVRAQGAVSLLYSNPLRGSNYGFQIPGTAMINGVTVGIKRRRVFNSRTGLSTVGVTYMPITVDYSTFFPHVSMFGLVGLITKLCTGITATGVLNMFSIRKIEYKGGIVINRYQTRYPRKLELKNI